MNLLYRQLSYLVLVILSALSMTTMSYADQILNTPKSIVLEVKLSHETNGDLEGATALQVNFQGVDSDSNVISFNPETGSTSTDVPLIKTVTFVSGEGAIQLTLKEGTLKNYSAIQIKIALDSSPTDFILIPFSSTIFALQSLEAERLTETSLFQVDPENEQIKIKNLVLMDDSSVYNDRTDFVSAAANSGITVNATNQIGILGPTAPGTTITYLSYNNTTKGFDWSTIAIDGQPLTQYTARQGIKLEAAVFKIDATGSSNGAIFTWDNATNKPKWISTANFFPHTGTNGIEVKADETIKLVDELTWTGTSFNISGAANITNGATVSGNTTIKGNTTITGNTTIVGDTNITGDVAVDGSANLTGSIRLGNNVSTQEGTIRYDDNDGIFYGFSGSAWEILNTNNISITIDNSTLWGTTAPNPTHSHTITGIERVGILTNTPTVALDVTGKFKVSSDATVGGNIQAAGNLDIDGTGNSTFAGNIQAAGNLDINGTGTSTIAGNIQAAGNLDIDGTGNSTFAGNVQADGNLDIDGTGNSTFAGNVNITGTLIAQNIAQDDTLDRLLVVSATATDPIKYRALSSLGSPAGDVGVTLNATSGEYELEQLVQGSGTLADDYELTWAGNLATGEPKWRKPYTGARGIDIDTDDDDRIIQITNTDADDNDFFVWDTDTAKWESLSNLMNSLTIASATITSLKMNTTFTGAHLNIQETAASGTDAIVVNVGGTAAGNRKFMVTDDGQVFVNLNSITTAGGDGDTTDYSFAANGKTYSQFIDSAQGNFGTTDTGTIGSLSGPTLLARDLAAANGPVFQVYHYSSGTTTTTNYFTVNQDKTLTLAKQATQPVDCSGDHDGKIFLTNAYILCVCDSTNWVRTSDGSNQSGCLNEN